MGRLILIFLGLLRLLLHAVKWASNFNKNMFHKIIVYENLTLQSS